MATTAYEAWKCPKCESDNLDVEITTWARLTQNGEDYSTDSTDGQIGDHEWDSTSGMQCRDCGHSATAQDFGYEVEEDDTEEEEVATV